MFPGMGGRGMNPKQLNQMMKQLGITVEDIDDVEVVIIRTPDREIVFTDATVSKMIAQGQTTWQLAGTPTERPRSEGAALDAPVAPVALYTDDDVALVVENAGVSEDEARKALDEAKGETAEAILKLIDE